MLLSREELEVLPLLHGSDEDDEAEEPSSERVQAGARAVPQLQGPRPVMGGADGGRRSAENPGMRSMTDRQKTEVTLVHR